MISPTGNPNAVPAPRDEELEERLDRLERQLAVISSDVASIRAELALASARPPRAASARPAESPKGAPPRSSTRSLDFESLLGRYGMLAIAVLAAVAAVGTFLSWAIHNGYLHLGPVARVMVGLGAACGLAYWGVRLRKRERSFGSSILGLALVIVQVCAHAAGPGFGLVPSYAAFAGAALISWALAIFAHTESDEPLWCVAFGGAALAPFVTSNGSGNVYGLLIYGLVVLLPGCFAISRRDWPIAWRVFYGIAALFALSAAGLSRHWGVWGFVSAYAFPFVVAAAGVVPFAAAHRKRAALRWLALLGVICSLGAPSAAGPNAWLIAGTLMASVILWLYLIDSQASTPQSSLLERARANPALLDWVDVAFVSLVITGEASRMLRGTINPLFAYLVALPLFLAFAWRRAVHSLRDASAFAAAASACAVAGMMPAEQPAGRITAFVALALILLLVAHRTRPSVSWLVTGILVFVGSALASVDVMIRRTTYAYTPFATEPSATALVVLLGLVCVTRFWYSLHTSTRFAMGDRPEWTYATTAQALIRGTVLAPWTWAFVWVLIELSMAYSASTSTLLLVGYFALTAVGCVGAGRARHSARLRQTGLGLALVAAGTAFYGATSYFDFGARIAAYLVTSAFLLGIAYWYRSKEWRESPQR